MFKACSLLLTKAIWKITVLSTTLITALAISAVCHAHHDKDTVNKSIWTEPYKSYWYSGQAELSSYRLKQARYGEIHEGTAVLVYVTEPVNPQTQIKADDYNAPDNIPVLKLNTTRKFNTGLYPYSMMTSVFFPVESRDHALKITASTQEWCGQVFTQLNYREQFEISAYSYFESEGDFSVVLPANHLENEIWTKLRIDPSALPQGNIQMLPSFEYLRLRHQPVKAYAAKAKLDEKSEEYVYTLEYQDLDRKVSIRFERAFPHKVLAWEEQYTSGFGKDAKPMTTSATLINTINTDYWNKKRNVDRMMREQLGLEQ
ncbi:hypothetical protein [Agaribacter flavus]|uniref:Septum formation inhibitor Maf n=1 Tax=Agaribacter flavus TaxID=1902781 RepID=A0ABV7FWM1_9ALTE